MRRLLIPLALAAMALSACGQGPTEKPQDDPVANKDFNERAEAVADAWRNTDKGDAWTTDLLLLDAAVKPPAGVELDEAQSSAVTSGWYKLSTELPSGKPEGEVPIPEAALQVDTWDAQQAFDKLAVGGEPPADCPREPVPDETSGEGEDGTTSHTAVCGVLEVTGVAPGTAPRWTNHGLVEVPVWSYTVEGLAEPLTQVAFDAKVDEPLPVIDLPKFERPENMTSAATIVEITGTSITYTLGAGACDVDFKPLAFESDVAIVLAGTMESDGSQMCTDQMVYQPVTTQISSEVGNRMFIDAVNGTVLKVGGYLPA